MAWQRHENDPCAFWFIRSMSHIFYFGIWLGYLFGFFGWKYKFLPKCLFQVTFWMLSLTRCDCILEWQPKDKQSQKLPNRLFFFFFSFAKVAFQTPFFGCTNMSSRLQWPRWQTRLVRSIPFVPGIVYHWVILLRLFHNTGCFCVKKFHIHQLCRY